MKRRSRSWRSTKAVLDWAHYLCINMRGSDLFDCAKARRVGVQKKGRKGRGGRGQLVWHVKPIECRIYHGKRGRGGGRAGSRWNDKPKGDRETGGEGRVGRLTSLFNFELLSLRIYPISYSIF